MIQTSLCSRLQVTGAPKEKFCSDVIRECLLSPARVHMYTK